MSTKANNARIIFGLKVKQLRQERKLSFSDLKEKSGLSVSYLNEIEKGKKYPKEAKIQALAESLGVSVEELISPTLSRGLAPISDLLHSNFLNDLPLDLFGIDLSKVVEIIANAPTRVGAFISTLVEISRNYALAEENFYHGAMRAYQELHFNYFEDIENEVLRFQQKHKLDNQKVITPEQLAQILEKEYKYSIVKNGLEDSPELNMIRSVYDERHKKLLLNKNLNSTQIAFQYGKELGFQFLKIKERAATSSLLRVKNFEQVLNHFRASYFAVALLINQKLFVEELKNFFNKTTWDGEAFLDLMKQFSASPEMLYLRLTNVIPKFFNIKKLFFLRFVHSPGNDKYAMNKEFHLSRKHHPHRNGLQEHYCRRWLSLSLLKDLDQIQKEGKYVGTIVGARRSKFYKTDDEYLCITLARPAYPTPNENVSVTIGLQIDDEIREKISFIDDPSISYKEVNNTCERCAIEDCKERAAPATYIEKKIQFKKTQEALKNILES